jgi:hypothetical protein
MQALLSNWLPLFNFAVVIALAGGGVLIFRGQRNKAVGEIQDRVVALLRNENEALTSQLEGVRKDLARLDATLATIRMALKRRGISMVINGEYVTLRDTVRPGTATTQKIRKVAAIEEATAQDDDDGAEGSNGA